MPFNGRDFPDWWSTFASGAWPGRDLADAGGYFDGGFINGEYFPPGFYYPDGSYFPPFFPTGTTNAPRQSAPNQVPDFSQSFNGFNFPDWWLDSGAQQIWPGNNFDANGGFFSGDSNFPAGFFFPDGSFIPTDGTGFDRFITGDPFFPSESDFPTRSASNQSSQRASVLVNWRIRA